MPSGLTPPATPTKATHSKTNSASSVLSTLSAHPQRTDSVTAIEPVTLEFPYWQTDYTYSKKDKLGEGVWSDVYLARPSLPNPEAQKPGAHTRLSEATPPITPYDLSSTTQSKPTQLPSLPKAYAIKHPASRSSKQVLLAEARILSHLTQFSDAEAHIVNFYGLDTRTGALVLRAMDTSLESWVQNTLNKLAPHQRTALLATTFPTLAISLLNSLAWMHARSCVHADIKPGNILLTTSSPGSPKPVYSDCSSSLLTTPSLTSSDTPSTLGGGTWDFLDPLLLSSKKDAAPSTESDLWALAMTLLFVVLGDSPFACVPGNNLFLRRDLIKKGEPMACVGMGESGGRNRERLASLGKALGWDVAKWFAKVLVGDAGKRVGMGEWGDEVKGFTVGSGGAKI
ncbi:kinase-like domain-containing protein [Dendryphion nanum]|uniref:Autophagy-related protein 1 n=1 Tax=Dendryphion nanum TaxID=256645 RepID=A0A9P9E1H7_9PLEO|nr:kinase-like domain-containing protein [Dendryphion nanum]